MSGPWRRSTTPAPAGGQDQKWRMPSGITDAGGREPFWTRREPFWNRGGGWSEVLPSRDVEKGSPKPFSTGGGGRSEILPSGGVQKGSSSSAPAMFDDLTVVDKDVLDCCVCSLPLKPPIFQCAVGHALCSSCSEKLNHTGKCHLCGVAMPGGYQRCHAMESVVNSISGPCSHARYGCTTRPVRHALEEHLQQCPHAPCQCPLQDSCNFVGSVTMLLGHFAAAHGCPPCTAEACAGKPFGVDLRDGINILTAVRGSDDRYLLLLNMSGTPFGHAISAVWVGSLAPAARNTTCKLELSFSQSQHNHVQQEHYLRSRFHVERTCSSKGLPDPNASCQFFVPKHVCGTEAGSHGASVHVTAVISISSA